MKYIFYWDIDEYDRVIMQKVSFEDVIKRMHDLDDRYKNADEDICIQDFKAIHFGWEH